MMGDVGSNTMGFHSRNILCPYSKCYSKDSVLNLTTNLYIC